jgi:hypothetical protein
MCPQCDAAPQPPYLCIREDKAFWAETRLVTDISATLQAVKRRCFRNAFCYDASGKLWPVRNATMRDRPSRIPLSPSRQYPVSLEVGPAHNEDVQEVISRLARILQSDNEFCEYLPIRPQSC